VWVRIFSLVSALIAGALTFPNGIHVYDFPAAKTGSSFEVMVGYRTGFRTEGDPSGDLSSIVFEYLKSTPSARGLALAAYGSGGRIEFVSDLERTGIRVMAPTWARPTVVALLQQFLSETPQKHPELVDRALEAVKLYKPEVMDVRLRVEEQVRLSLFGPESRSTLNSITRKNVEEFFAKYFGTDRAFVVIDGDAADFKSIAERKSLAAAEIPGKEGPPRQPPACCRAR